MGCASPNLLLLVFIFDSFRARQNQVMRHLLRKLELSWCYAVSSNQPDGTGVDG